MTKHKKMITAKNPRDIPMKESCMVSENNILPYIASLSEFMHESGTKVKPYPKVILSKDKSNATDPFGKTAFYDHSLKEVTLYTEGRHIKDVLRSFAHEMVHHSDNLKSPIREGMPRRIRSFVISKREPISLVYMRFRDWEDSIKDQK